MTSIQRSAIVPHSASRMFALVNDIESYPRRFSWCEHATIVEEGPGYRVARLQLRLGILHTAFTTRNILFPPHRIGLALVDGPFRRLSGEWLFTPLNEHACKVMLTLEFETHRIAGLAFALGFQHLADRMVDDFCRAARQETVTP